MLFSVYGANIQKILQKNKRLCNFVKIENPGLMVWVYFIKVLYQSFTYCKFISLCPSPLCDEGNFAHSVIVYGFPYLSFTKRIPLLNCSVKYSNLDCIPGDMPKFFISLEISVAFELEFGFATFMFKPCRPLASNICSGDQPRSIKRLKSYSVNPSSFNIIFPSAVLTHFNVDSATCGNAKLATARVTPFQSPLTADFIPSYISTGTSASVDAIKCPVSFPVSFILFTICPFADSTNDA